jgi:hypothetical protein
MRLFNESPSHLLLLFRLVQPFSSCDTKVLFRIRSVVSIVALIRYSSYFISGFATLNLHFPRLGSTKAKRITWPSPNSKYERIFIFSFFPLCWIRQAIDARRVLPCWDEPAIKARFQLTLTFDSALDAVSNTEVLFLNLLLHRFYIFFFSGSQH